MTKQVSRTTSRMFPSCLKLLVLYFLFLSIESHSGQILPPQNLSLVWKHDFKPELTWQPFQQAGCKYRVKSETSGKLSNKRNTMESPPWSPAYIVMEGGYLHLTVVTLCGDNESKAAVLNTTYPEIVKELECYVFSSKLSRCSWKAVNSVPDLRFFYGLAKEDLSVSASNNSVPPLRECPSYIKDGDIRTGCELEATKIHSVIILFNRTVNGSLVRNTFQKHLNNVKPPPLEWNVTKVGDNFNISWRPVDIDLPWEYMFNYSECGKSKVKNAGRGSSYQLDRVPQCPYSIKIRAESGSHSTPWSDVQSFDADADADTYPNAVVLAAIVIPLVFAGLAVLTFVCCRKNKEHIFPKVPQPRDFLSDIYNNNNKSTIRDLYIPAEEEENCKITLVMDPQNEYNPDY